VKKINLVQAVKLDIKKNSNYSPDQYNIRTNFSQENSKEDKKLIVLNKGRDFESSCILTVTYDIEQNHLGICFENSPFKIYIYEGVSLEVYSKFLVSESLGRALNDLIKPIYHYWVVDDIVEYVNSF
jgi:hypothetical protein